MDIERDVMAGLLNLKHDGAVLNIPLFLADWTGKLLEMQQLAECSVSR